MFAFPGKVYYALQVFTVIANTKEIASCTVRLLSTVALK